MPAAVTGGMLVDMAKKRKSTAKTAPDQLRNRALFELGRDSQQLLVRIHHQYLGAGQGAGFPANFDSLAAQINTSLSALADGFRGTKSSRPLRDLRKAFDTAWKQLRREWLGKKHLDLVRVRENTEPDLLPQNWWQENSPLKRKAWKHFREAFGHLASKLAELDETLLTTGQLMSQVLGLSDWSPRQNPLFGEPDPTPTLQAGLLKLRVLLGLDIDVELRGALAQPASHDTVRASLDRIHRELLEHISQTKSTGRDRKRGSTPRTSSKKKPAIRPIPKKRQSKWEDLYRLHDQLKTANPTITDREIIKAYRKRYRRRTDQPTLATLRNYRFRHEGDAVT